MRVPCAVAGAFQPAKVRLEGVPLVDVEHDEDGGDGEHHHDEDVAHLGCLLPAQHLPAAVSGVVAAAGEAAANSLAAHNNILRFSRAVMPKGRPPQKKSRSKHLWQ